VEWITEDWSEIPGRDNKLPFSPGHFLNRSGTHAVSSMKWVMTSMSTAA